MLGFNRCVIYKSMTGLMNMAEHECEGACSFHGDCTGEVKRVRVTKGIDNWGDWWYCDYAIEQDRRHGFDVELL